MVKKAIPVPFSAGSDAGRGVIKRSAKTGGRKSAHDAGCGWRRRAWSTPNPIIACADAHVASLLECPGCPCRQPPRVPGSENRSKVERLHCKSKHWKHWICYKS